MTGTFVKSADYAAWLGGLKSRIRSARLSAARSVNRELILLYWDIGRGVVEKQEALGWGKAVVETLSRDLKIEFPQMTGFSSDNLWRMRQFYGGYSSHAFLSQARKGLDHLKIAEFLEQTVPELRDRIAGEVPEHAVPELLLQVVRGLVSLVPWGHHVEIMKKVSNPVERLYYLRATAQFGWTRNVLMNQIKAGAYEHSLAEGKLHNFPAALPEHLAEQAEEALKSSYNLEFLGISHEVKERAKDDNPSIGIVCVQSFADRIEGLITQNCHSERSEESRSLP